MSAGGSFQACGAATENDLEPKTVRERGTSKWPRCADRRCALPGRCDTFWLLFSICRPKVISYMSMTFVGLSSIGLYLLGPGSYFIQIRDLGREEVTRESSTGVPCT